MKNFINFVQDNSAIIVVSLVTLVCSVAAIGVAMVSCYGYCIN